MTFYEKMILQDLKIPFAFGNAEDGWAPPFLVYRGSGAESFSADDSNYYTRPGYELQYYFTEKDEEEEQRIERILLDAGYRFQKSEDNYIQENNMWVIYYEVN